MSAASGRHARRCRADQMFITIAAEVMYLAPAGLTMTTIRDLRSKYRWRKKSTADI